jgi:23S rRNA pseudouridine1911/1915/1917 synthase
MSSKTKQIFSAEKNSPRLDLWLKDQFPDLSRSMLQRLIREKHVLLKGESCSPKSCVSTGDQIEVDLPPPESASLQPEAIPLKVLFEDQYLIALNKPPGMVVHPGAGNSKHTLVHALLHHCRGELSGIGGVERPGIVHRLDKDTSGCIVVAKTDSVHRQLSEAFQSRTVEKIYLAFVWGKPRMLSGKINKPIGRHAVHRTRMAVRTDGRPSLTDWKISKAFNGITLLECRIHSGRTHQIRVHLASEELAVVGDSVYGRPRNLSHVRRHMLHAWKLSFDHPVTHVRITLEAPMPEDMKVLLRELEEASK